MKIYITFSMEDRKINLVVIWFINNKAVPVTEIYRSKQHLLTEFVCQLKSFERVTSGQIV